MKYTWCKKYYPDGKFIGRGKEKRCSFEEQMFDDFPQDEDVSDFDESICFELSEMYSNVFGAGPVTDQELQYYRSFPHPKTASSIYLLDPIFDAKVCGTFHDFCHIQKGKYDRLLELVEDVGETDELFAPYPDYFFDYCRNAFYLDDYLVYEYCYDYSKLGIFCNRYIPFYYATLNKIKELTYGVRIKYENGLERTWSFSEFKNYFDSKIKEQ